MLLKIFDINFCIFSWLEPNFDLFYMIGGGGRKGDRSKNPHNASAPLPVLYTVPYMLCSAVVARHAVILKSNTSLGYVPI